MGTREILNLVLKTSSRLSKRTRSDALLLSVHYYSHMCVSDVLNSCHMHQICNQYITERHKILAVHFKYH